MNKVEYEFRHLDEFQREKKVFIGLKNTEEDALFVEFEEILDNFKKFLLVCGYAQETVDKIQIVED